MLHRPSLSGAWDVEGSSRLHLGSFAFVSRSESFDELPHLIVCLARFLVHEQLEWTKKIHYRRLLLRRRPPGRRGGGPPLFLHSCSTSCCYRRIYQCMQQIMPQPHLLFESLPCLLMSLTSYLEPLWSFLDTLMRHDFMTER